MALKKVFVFGNPLVEKDSLALEVAKRLGRMPGIEFVYVESLDDAETTGDLYIMDVCEGLEKVETIEDIARLDASSPVSAHDFDLAMELKVREKIGEIGKVKIIAIPVGFPIEKAVACARLELEKV